MLTPDGFNRRNDPQVRPSGLNRVYFYLVESEAEANDLYGRWLADLIDLNFFLRPLLGMVLLCDCDRGLSCHVHTLLRVLDRVFPPAGFCGRRYGIVNVCLFVFVAPLAN